MIAVDTSVVVAALAAWHEGHTTSRETVQRRPRLIAHVALETYSVLTRLPPPHRVSPAVVHAYLLRQFPEPWLTLAAEEHRSLLDTLHRRGVGGGAVYDALVAATAVAAGATLLTRDVRARPVYALLNADVQVLR
ncbi:MAG: PIN domain-containing protein [Egibacteraceae bacterium]